MQFKATTWTERNYKIVAAFLVLLSTAICCYAFIKIPTGEASFFVSLIYALALYLIGVFTSAISARISSEFQHRVEIYTNLKRANDLLNTIIEEREPLFKTKTANDIIDEIYDDIITFIVFTGNKDDERLKNQPYIKKLGITYDESFLQEINTCKKTVDTIVKDVNTKLIEHIQQNNVQATVPYPHFTSKHICNPQAWCSEYIIGNHEKELSLIYDIYDQYHDEFELLRNSLLSIEAKFHLYRESCMKTISQVERLYGRKLTDFLEQEKWHYEDVEYVKKAIEDAESNISERLDSIQEELESLSNHLDDC